MADPAGLPEASAPSSGQSTSAVDAAPHAPVQTGIWERIKAHKVVQWTLAYAAAAYTLLHVTEMISEAMEWPHLIARVLTLALVLGAPVVITLAWYHGAKGLRRFSAAELTIITILLMIAGSVLWSIQRNRGEPGASARVATSNAAPNVAMPPATPAAPRTAIAVMPFANLTGDPSKDYLGDGMSEELINVLTKVPGLKVPARTSSFAYKGRNTDIRQIAKDLGVGTVLEGSVRAAGKRIRITAQLINAQDGLHIWSETYDERFTDLFELQDHLAKAIVQALQGSLNGSPRAPVTTAPPTQDMEAYQLYLQARSIQNGTEPRLKQALALYDQALARDPKFARAYSAMAEIRAVYMVLGYPLPHALEDAEREANQALALDPNLAGAQAVLGIINSFRGNWLKAEANFRAAMLLDANDAQIRSDYAGYVSLSAGHVRQAAAHSYEAHRLAPADPFSTQLLAATYSISGLDAEALKYADLAIELGASPNVTPIPQIYANAAKRHGHYAEAADRIMGNLPASLTGAGGDEVIRGVYAALGDPSKIPAARNALQNLLHKLKAEDLDVNTRKDMIELFTQLDALDVAFDLANQSLDQFARTGTVGSNWGVLWLPEMRPFRQDARFQDFVTRLGLMEYWKQYGPPDDCDLKDGKLICR
jgi:TolB-like protein